MYDDAENEALQVLADTEERRTFDEWVSLGYCICKGSKCVARNGNGIALFDRTQVYDDDDELFGYTDVYQD